MLRTTVLAFVLLTHVTMAFANDASVCGQLRDLSAPLIGGVILQLLGLDPFAVLPTISRCFGLIAVGEHVILADQVVLQIGHAATSGAFGLALVEMQANRCAWTRFTTVSGRATTSVADIGLVDTAGRIGVVPNVAFDGVCAFELLPDHGIAVEVSVTRLPFRVL
jgi:hypothetical protein